ncbi:hypothetical protein DFQ26_005952 [Actinomortierella ambigua]|nr:hypothetical protein DFQ26_005952 [Actinomortierella ambigua]
MNDANNTPTSTDTDLRDLLERMQQQMEDQRVQMEDQRVQMEDQRVQMEEQQERICQLEAEMRDSQDRVISRNSRATTLKIYDELLEQYPAIGMANFFNAELTKDHDIFDWNDYHYTQGMEYKAPPVLEHSEISLPTLAKQHDQDLAKAQGLLANNTRLYDSLAHELIQSGVAESEVGQRVFDFLNVARVSAANDASKISRMRSDIYLTAL